MSIDDHTRVHDDFMSRLVRATRPGILTTFHTMFRCALTECQSSDQPQLVLIATQRLLTGVPNWPPVRIREIHQTIADKCPDFDLLIDATLSSRLAMYVRCYGMSRTFDRMNPTDFIHTVLIRCARKFYINPQRLHEDSDPTIRRNNFQVCEQIVSSAVREVVQSYIPIRKVITRLPPQPIGDIANACAPVETKQRQSDYDSENEGEDGAVIATPRDGEDNQNQPSRSVEHPIKDDDDVEHLSNVPPPVDEEDVEPPPVDEEDVEPPPVDENDADEVDVKDDTDVSSPVEGVAEAETDAIQPDTVITARPDTREKDDNENPFLSLLP